MSLGTQNQNNTLQIGELLMSYQHREIVPPLTLLAIYMPVHQIAQDAFDSVL